MKTYIWYLAHFSQDENTFDVSIYGSETDAKKAMHKQYNQLVKDYGENEFGFNLHDDSLIYDYAQMRDCWVVFPVADGRHTIVEWNDTDTCLKVWDLNDTLEKAKSVLTENIDMENTDFETATDTELAWYDDDDFYHYRRIV